MSIIPYKIERSVRAKRVRISVNCNDGVIVTVPKRVSLGMIEKFVQIKTDWIRQALDQVQSQSRVWIKPAGVQQESYAACRDRARKFIRDRVFVYNAHYNFTYQKISVKNMTSRWGSCSKGQNLNFHYRLLFLPIELADYVIIHELCHLQELNHSKKFWRLVTQTCPDYRARRRELRWFAGHLAQLLFARC